MADAWFLPKRKHRDYKQSYEEKLSLSFTQYIFDHVPRYKVHSASLPYTIFRLITIPIHVVHTITYIPDYILFRNKINYRYQNRLNDSIHSLEWENERFVASILQ